MKTRAALPALTVVAVLIAASLSACTARAALVIHSTTPRLRQGLSALAERYTRSAGLQLVVSDAPGAHAVRVEIGWAFPAPRGEPGDRPIPDQVLRKSGYGTALAFERWARGDAGWRALPVLWDAWGMAGPPTPGKAAGSSGTFEWKDRTALVTTGQAALAPLGDPGTRQALFWFSSGLLPEEAVVTGIIAGGSERSSAPGLAHFESLAALGKDSFLSRNKGNTRLVKADVENIARNTGAGWLFGDYQWLRTGAGSAPGLFRALTYPSADGPAMPVSLLVGTVSGSGPAADRALEFLVWLASPENQKELSNASGFMAANFSAVNLDPGALEARQAAIKAARVVLVDPEPRAGSPAGSWDSVLERVLAKPVDWKRTLAEK
jgi:hypothetical protein